ncbi:HPP family protein [Arcobacter arenosus]|uniref:CBS domain-containing protein n=1 Tax=Arcobacter arenosus TaxID=2576037 RepID=A0A5R8XZI6_9BACT|nr:CBS domain-containing protein [Arcobacter arenosus]TLP37534.1 CBS domain-containing protein [Arcobacter arenosus]
MFAIYNNNGLSFRSTIDNLYTLSNVDSIARVRNNTEEGLPKDHSLKSKKKLYENQNIEEAKAVYKKMANIDTKEPIFHVEDLMTRDVISLNEDNTLLEAYELMQEHEFRQIPVLKKDDNQIIGLVTQEFILDLLVGDLEFAQNIMQRELSTFDFNEVITSDPITDIRRVAKVMVDFSLTAIPVVDQDDNLLGIVSRANILKAVANTPPMQIWG